MNDFIWLNSKNVYINKMAITSIEKYTIDNFWKIKMNDGDCFIVHECELREILGVSNE